MTPEQHCGRRTNHDRHKHWARPRPVVLPCTCDSARACVCPSSTPAPVRKQLFVCTGELVTEGAPAHLPTQIQT